MDWKSAAAYYVKRLSEALDVQRHALALAELPQAEVPPEKRKLLFQQADPARKQLDRLKRGEFRIAVVGLEKSGKSTFVNAWLECDLLPAKRGRCTFTTTQVFSVKSLSEQRLEVEPKSHEKFELYVADLKRISEAGEPEAARKAGTDLATIKQHEQSLRHVLDDGRQTFQFTSLPEIGEPLRKFVADERFAHAVHEARLYTSQLAATDGIIFYDVPGLDSGLAKHIEESREMLADCDAIILVQMFEDLREREKDLLRFAEEGDINVPVRDKLFVFLSYADTRGSRDDLAGHLESVCKNWKAIAELPPDRIVAGSAGAWLVLRGVAGPETLKSLGDPESVRQKLRMVKGVEGSDLELEEAAGVTALKKRVFNYIDSDRVGTLRTRCERSIGSILRTAQEIRDEVGRRFPESPEEAKRHAAESRNISFSQWWGGKWNELRAAINVHYAEKVLKKADDGRTTLACFEKFQQRFTDAVQEGFKALPQRQEQARQEIFRANSNPVFDPPRANLAWRDALYPEVCKMIEGVATTLAMELRQEARSLVDVIQGLLWDSRQVQTRLIENEEAYFADLERSLRVLFLRFARPVADALVRAPVGSRTREEIVRELGMDVELVDNYYTGEEEAFKQLKRFAQYGEKLFTDPELRALVLGSIPIKHPVVQLIQKIAQIFQKLKSENPDPRQVDVDLLTHQQNVIREVEVDLEALQEYLLSAVFEASGFRSFALNELQALRDRFLGNGPTWAGVAQNEWQASNPRLLAVLPPELRTQDFDVEVSNRLRQLSIALQAVSAVNAG